MGASLLGGSQCLFVHTHTAHSVDIVGGGGEEGGGGGGGGGEEEEGLFKANP